MENVAVQVSSCTKDEGCAIASVRLEHWEAHLQEPTSGEKVAKIVDRVFNRISKASAMLASLAVSINVSRPDMVDSCLEKEEQYNLLVPVAKICTAVAVGSFAVSTIARQMAQRKETERISTFSQKYYQTKGPDTEFTLVHVRFRK